MLHELLQELGFTKKEIDVYLAILQSGKIAVADLAAAAGLNRTTVYGIVRALLKKKVIREDIAASKTFLLARPPEDLYLLVEKDKQRIHQREHLINRAIGELASFAKNTRYSVPKIVFVEEDEVEDHLYRATEKWDKSILANDGIWWGFQDHTFVECYQKWIDWSWKQPFVGAMRVKLLTNESEVEQRMQRKKIAARGMKFWKPEDAPFSASTWVCGAYLILIITGTRPRYLVEIHDAVLGRNMALVFKELWDRV